MNKKSLVILVIIFSLLLCSTTIYAVDQSMTKIDSKSIKNLEIDVGGAEIIFDRTSSEIYLSKELKTTIRGTNLHIYDQDNGFNFFNWFDNKEDKIIIGTNRKYSNVEIDAGGIELRGDLQAEKILLDGGGLDINAKLTADEVEVDGGGIELQGMIVAKELLIDGGGMTIDLEVKEIRSLDLDGAGMSVDIKYLDSWVGTRYLSVDGAGSSIDLLVPSFNNSEQDGQLDVDTDGIIDVDVDYY